MPARDKIKAVKKALSKSQPISRIARDLGVSRKTLYQWIKKYQLSPNRSKANALELKYPRGIDHPLAKRFVLQKMVIKSIIKNPKISLDELTKTLKKQRINISKASLYRNLKDLDLNKRQLRELVLQYWQGPGRFTPSLKQEIIQKIVKREISITEAANLHNISRKSLYAWLNEYQTAISAGTAVIKELQDKYVKAESHPKSIYPKIQAGLVETVKQNPELSTRQLSQLLNSSPATIWRVLDRYNLNKFEDRQLFASRYAPIITTEASKPLIDVVSIPSLDQLSPDVMPGPPPPKLSPVVVSTSSPLPTSASVRFKSFIIFTSIGFITGSTTYLSISTLISAKSFSQLTGYLLAHTALLLGMFFFAYSVRYYLVIIYLLLFSRRLSLKLEQSERDQNDGADQGQDLIPGLIPDLSHITLFRHPFVSIHLPLYNEKRVVNRLLEAVTSMDYDNYEVIVCDDSTDETKDIVNEWHNHPRIKIIHRDTRTGFKGGALKEALKLMDSQTEYVLVFDADFLPYPDTIKQFLKYFQVASQGEVIPSPDTIGERDPNRSTAASGDPHVIPMSIGTPQDDRLSLFDYSQSRIAAVQGYQWHVLNKSENWITRGVRTEYAGSYVIERSAAEIYQGLKQIAGSVYMVRADLLQHYNWSSSLTEDFELTLRLYRDGYKVVYTPYIQAPSECVSTIKRLIRQRMRWAEGHSFNIKKYFRQILFAGTRVQELGSRGGENYAQLYPKPYTLNPNLTLAEKLEFLYLSPYYLQSAFFILGTFSWFISEAVFKVKLPFWTAVWGWSLVLTNMFSLPLMNLVGLFLEEAEEKDYGGIPAFILLTYILAPFQAYASIKGFLESQEGPWFRTPKTGKVTDIYRRSQFYRWIRGFFGPQVIPVQLATVRRYKTEINHHHRHHRLGRVITALLLIFSFNISYLTLGVSLTKPINPGNLALAAEPNGPPPTTTEPENTGIQLTDYRHQAGEGVQNPKKLNVKVAEGLADKAKEKLIFNESDINDLINQAAGSEVTWLTQTGQPFAASQDRQGLDIFIKGEGSQIIKYRLSKEWPQISLAQADKNSGEFTELVTSKPIFEYQDGKYFWQDYTEGTIKTTFTPQTGYVRVLQQFPLYGPTAPDLLAQAELELKLGYIDNKLINKLTFKILPNENQNRLIWQIEQKTDNKVEMPGVLSAPLPEPAPSLGTVDKQHSAPKESADITHDKPRFETDNLTIDWSDFQAEPGSLTPQYPMSLVYPMCLSSLKPVTAIPWEHERAGNTDKIIFYPKGKQGELVIDPSISTTTTVTSVTVSVANQFEVVFNGSKGGVIDSWYDLENDSGKADQLADATDGLFDFYGSDGSVRRISDSTSTTQTVLENSGTRAVIQYTGNLGAVNYNYVLTYTIYPTGDIYIKLQITNNTGSTITWTEQRAEITVDSATNHTADGDGVTTDGQAMTVGTNNWVKWVGDGTTEKDTAVLYHYSGFNYVEYYATGTKVALERDTSETQANAATTTRYFRLNLRPDTDSLGTTETEPDKYANDLLHPDDLTDGISGAQGWFDTSEATAASVDSFNEAEGAYTVEAVSRTISWWNNQWGRRKPLTLVNNSGQDFEANTTVAVTVNTKTLYDTGELQSDCDDLRILYQPDSSTTTELSRYVSYPGGGACSTSEATKVNFPLQAAITNGSNSTAYYLYYKNSSASTPSNPDNAFDIGAKDALLVCPFDGTTTCAAAETPSTSTGAIRYSGAKSAMSFDGTAGDYVGSISSGLQGANQLTLESWVYRNRVRDAGNSADNVIKEQNWGSYLMEFDWASTQKIRFYIQTGTTYPGTSYTCLSNSNVNLNEWTHIAGTYDGINTRIFINGSLDKTCSASGNIITNSGNIEIGRAGATSYYSGIIDEVRVSDVARYTSTFTPSTSPFVRDSNTKLLLHFDENGDDPRNTGKAIDDSGNGNHGTITGAKYVAGLVGVDGSTSSPSETGKADGGNTYAGHEGIFIEEGATNKITNPSFDHSTYNTNWSTADGTLNYNSSSDTFTAGMQKRTAPGPFAGAPIVQGEWNVDANKTDRLTTSAGTQINGNFYQNLDMNQGSVVVWWTPEFSSSTDNTYHYVFDSGGTRIRSYYSGSSDRFEFCFWTTCMNINQTVTAGTTYQLVFRWDLTNTLNGTNYASFSINDSHTHGITSVPSLSAPTSIVVGTDVNGYYVGNALIEGLTIYRRPLFDGTYGIDVGNGDEINQIYNSGTGKDPTLVTGSWDVVFDLPTNSSTGALATGTGEAWTHPHASNLLYTSTTNTGGFMMNGTYTSDGWADEGTPSVSALGASSKIFAGGYAVTSDAANEGIYYDKTVTAGNDWVVRALANSDGTSVPKIILYDQTNGAEIGSLTGTTTSTRAAPNVFIFTGEAPASSTTLRVKLVNTQASGTTYWHQVEVLSNLIDKPSMESGSGDPWIPSGWSNLGLDAGESTQDTSTPHSGSSAIHVNANSVNEGLSQSYAPSDYTIGSYWSVGSYAKVTSGSPLMHQISRSALDFQYASIYNAAYQTLSGSTWKHYAYIGRKNQSGNPYHEFTTSTGYPAEFYVDDAYSFKLTDVSLTVTPASEANSSETSGLRVDGNDTLTQTVKNLTDKSGEIIFEVTPRHNFDIAENFGFTGPVLASIYGDANDYIKLVKVSDTVLRAEAQFNGTSVNADTSVAPTLNAGTTYIIKVTYLQGSYLKLYIDGVEKASTAIGSSTAFSTTPATIYFGSDNAGSNQYDLTVDVAAVTAATPSENTTAPYYKFGSKSAKINNSAGDGTNYVISIDPNSTSTHTVSAYVYDATSGNVGGTVDSKVASLVSEGATPTTTYTDIGGGWWRLTYADTSVSDAASNFGLHITNGKTVYIDGLQLEEKAYATTYADGTLGTSYSWSGTAHESTSSRTTGTLTYSATNNVQQSAGSVSFWVKLVSAPIGTSTLTNYFIHLQNGLGYTGITYSDQYSAFVFWGDGGLAGAAVNVTPTQNVTWYHVVGTWATGQDKKLYVNAGTPATDSESITVNTINIGYNNWNNTRGDSVISDLRVYDSALTSTEVADVYYAGLLSHQDGDELTSTEPIQVTVDMDGGTYNRINPNLKIRSWRDTRLPSSVMLENTNLNNTYSYNASLKIFSEAWFDDNGSETQIADGGDQSATDDINIDGTSGDYTLTGLANTDYLYLGSNSKFTGANYHLSTIGAGGVITWQYWNGSIWTALSGVTNEVAGSSALATNNGSFYYTEPSDWTAKTLTSGSEGITGERSLYWIRADVTTSFTSVPTIDRMWTDILLFQFLSTITGNDQTFIITTSPVRESLGSIQIDVPNRYRAILATGDTTDYIVFYDRAQSDSSPNATHEFKGPCILETNTYCLRDDANRITTILESTATRVRVRVEGKFNNEAGTDYLDDESGTPLLLTVSEDYTFTTEGLSVYNTTDFRSTGVTLDAASGHNGYEWLGVYADVTDGAFDDTGNVTYGTGETEGTTSTDGVAVANSNLYFFLPGTGSNTYQDAFIGIQRTGWYDDTTGGTHQWYWDEAESGTQDLLTAQEQNHLTTSVHSSKWYFLLLPEASLDTEAERESYFNDNWNPDILTYTTGSEWDDAPGSPGLKFDGTDDYVSIADSATLDYGTGDFSISLWVKTSQTCTGNKVYWGQRSGSDPTIWVGCHATGNTAGFDADSNLTSFASISGTTAINDGRWHYLTAVKSGHASAYVYLYVDGQLETSNGPRAYSGTFDFAAGNVNAIGRLNVSPYYYPNALIDEVRVYNYARTQAQIQQDMFKQIDPSTDSGLVGYWRLNENTGQSALDETTNNNDGTLGVDTGSSTDDPTWTTGYVSDYYNEAEGAYTVNAASDQLSVDIDGGDNVSTLLNGAVSAGATSITVDSTTGFPDGGGTTTYVAYIDGDKFSYTDATATTFTGIPATGELSVIGHADNSVVTLMNRHKPFYKVRGYRLNTEPSSVTLEGSILSDGTDYNLDVKPVSDAYFAQDATWYSTLESSSAVTSPDIGSAGTVNGADFTVGRYGNGARFNADDESVSFAIATNFDKAHGAFEMWYQPNYDSSSTTTTRAIAGDIVDGSNQFTLAYGGSDQGGNGELSFYINENGSARSVYFLNSEFSWKAGDWVHIRAVWDDTLSSSDLKLYLNGVATSNRLNDGLYNSVNLTLGSNFYVGNDDAAPAASEANGVIDEFRMYDFSAGGGTPTDLAEGGDTADSDEYLYDTANDFTFSFAEKDSAERGEYAYFGSDSRFSGLNVDLTTLGVGNNLNLEWEYWDGDSWTDLEAITGFTDGTSNFTQDGAVYWSADPTNWRPYSVNGSTDLYHIRVSLDYDVSLTREFTTSPVEDTIKTDILLLQYLSSVNANDQTLVIVPEFIWNLIPLIIGSTLIMKKRHLKHQQELRGVISNGSG